MRGPGGGARARAAGGGAGPPGGGGPGRPPRPRDRIGRRRRTGGGRRQQLPHLLGADLGEIPERGIDRQEGRGHRGAHHVVGEAADLPAGGFRRGGDRDHQVGRFRGTDGVDRREQRCARGSSVVDDDHGAPGERGGRPVAATRGPVARQFRGRVAGGGAHLLGGEPQAANHVVVDHDAAVGGQCADDEFGTARRPECPDHQHIQRRRQRRRDLPGHGYPAAGQPQSHPGLVAAVVLEQRGERPARLAPVAEDRRRAVAQHGKGRHGSVSECSWACVRAGTRHPVSYAPGWSTGDLRPRDASVVARAVP